MSLSDAEQQLEQAIEDLDSKETITAEDLEAFRQSLPTDPELARLAKLSLPYPMDEIFEYVEGSEHQAAYWRTAPNRSKPRSEADAAHRERWREAAKATEGTRGTVERKGRTVPQSAAILGDSVEGRGLSQRAGTAGRKALRKLRAVLES